MNSPEDLRRWLAGHIAAGSAYGRVGYVYGYPHKKAYRPLEAPRTPREVWRDEPRRCLSCYVHLPFCTMRCSFCNLFTHVPGDEEPADAYLDALTRQMAHYADVLRPATFRNLYLGGGTPTYLSVAQLRRLVAALWDFLGIEPRATMSCIEASPETLDEEKVAALRELGFLRLSLGIQSFVEQELRHVNRRFTFAQNRAAVETVGRAGFPFFNIDLIYGLPGQTGASWRYSLERAIDSPATSLFLYPLYVRPLTGLDRRRDLPPAPAPPEMGRLYDVALERLTAVGFRQVTMRQFRRDPGAALVGIKRDAEDLEYRCQRDGLLGLGAGARSYTRALHYSTPWRMVARNIRAVIADYEGAWRSDDALIRHGFALDADEQRCRFVILSLLYDGLDCAAFADAFAADARALFAPQWQALFAEGCVHDDGAALRLTARGVRHSDVVGHLFFSDRVRRLAETFEYDR
jgi:oxygen-independent coproporphyrinogen-3 oxidase